MLTNDRGRGQAGVCRPWYSRLPAFPGIRVWEEKGPRAAPALPGRGGTIKARVCPPHHCSVVSIAGPLNIRYQMELSEAERARLRGLAPLLLHALHIAFESVQPLLPDGPLFAKPILGHDEARWHKTVATLATLLRRLEHARSLENTKVLGEGWQSHLIRLGEFGH